MTDEQRRSSRAALQDASSTDSASTAATEGENGHRRSARTSGAGAAAPVRGQVRRTGPGLLAGYSALPP